MPVESISAQSELRHPVTRRQFCSDVIATSVVATVGLPRSGGGASKAKPFVKWAGGKGQLISQLEALFPSDLASRDGLTYVEPFVGGGAMVFHMLGKYRTIRRVVINDFNSDLVCTYSVVRDSPEALIEVLSKFQAEYRTCCSEEKRKEYYLQKRGEYNRRKATAVETAALFIFLNRTCFNGLYRVNSKGLYNVPFGRAANPLICDAETLRADSVLLQNVEIIQGDFEGVYDHIKGTAFVYLDPPYRPLPKTPSFTAYSKNGFNDAQQKRLAEFCRKLDKDGHLWLQSNSDPANTDPDDKFFDDLYRGFDIQRVSASRMINSKADGRGKITELAIRNYRG
ncbi:MAG: DNA adenine methylase [Kiritimatiellia bacterium]